MKDVMWFKHFLFCVKQTNTGYSGSHGSVVGSVIVSNLKTGVQRAGWDKAEVLYSSSHSPHILLFSFNWYSLFFFPAQHQHSLTKLWIGNWYSLFYKILFLADWNLIVFLVTQVYFHEIPAKVIDDLVKPSLNSSFFSINSVSNFLFSIFRLMIP